MCVGIMITVKSTLGQVKNVGSRIHKVVVRKKKLLELNILLTDEVHRMWVVFYLMSGGTRKCSSSDHFPSK